MLPFLRVSDAISLRLIRRRVVEAAGHAKYNRTVGDDVVRPRCRRDTARSVPHTFLMGILSPDAASLPGRWALEDTHTAIHISRYYDIIS